MKDLEIGVTIIPQLLDLLLVRCRWTQKTPNLNVVFSTTRADISFTRGVLRHSHTQDSPVMARVDIGYMFLERAFILSLLNRRDLHCLAHAGGNRFTMSN